MRTGGPIAKPMSCCPPSSKSALPQTAQEGAETMSDQGTLRRGWTSCGPRWGLRALMLAALAILAALTAATGSGAQAATTVEADPQWGQMPLYFIANQGQLDSPVAYYVQGSDKTLYFTPQGVTFALTDAASAGATPRRRHSRAPRRPPAGSSSRISWTPIRSRLRDRPRPRPSSPTSRAPRRSGTPDSPPTPRIVYPDLWDGIDLLYSGTFNQLKHEFIVATRGRPGPDPPELPGGHRAV